MDLRRRSLRFMRLKNAYQLGWRWGSGATPTLQLSLSQQIMVNEGNDNLFIFYFFCLLTLGNKYR